VTKESERPASDLPAASLQIRVGAMIYDALLLTGLAFVVSYAMLASLQWSYPLSPGRRLGLQAVLFVGVGIYLIICWTRAGQTLGMKAWRIKVIDADGRPPRTARAIARYVLAWHLWLPGLTLAALFHYSTSSSLVMLAVGFALLLMPALFDRQRRLLHDRWTGTRVARVP
jgi:uncharacterized RDD family membrane protein YckC